MIILKTDEEVQGNRKEIPSVEELSKELNSLLDERVYEVVVKKKAPERTGKSVMNLEE